MSFVTKLRTYEPMLEAGDYRELAVTGTSGSRFDLRVLHIATP
jgi:hypothetical protein